MAVEVLGVDHIFVTVRDLVAAEEFYDKVMPVLGFRKHGTQLGGEVHINYYNRHFAFWLRPARDPDAAANPYAAGVHHFCFRVGTEDDVKRAAAALQSAGVAVSPPRFYPEYGRDYYATYFTGPDGLRLEIRNYGEWWRQASSAWRKEGRRQEAAGEGEPQEDLG